MRSIYIDAQQMYGKYLDNPADNSTNNELFIDWYENSNINAREEIILRNVKLVLYAAKSFVCIDCAYTDDDLLQVGILGLIKAVDSFDYTKGNTFSTYALYIIKNEFWMLWRKWKYTSKVLSLNETILGNDESEIETGDLIPDPNDFKDALDYQIDLMLIDNGIDALSEKEKEIICYYYGLRGQTKHKQKECAEHFNVTQSYFSKVKSRAINKVRNYWLDRI